MNNAGTVNFEFDKELAIRDMEVNYIGTKSMTEAMLPLFKPSDAGARIVFISSRVGQLIVSIRIKSHLVDHVEQMRKNYRPLTSQCQMHVHISQSELRSSTTTTSYKHLCLSGGCFGAKKLSTL